MNIEIAYLKMPPSPRLLTTPPLNIAGGIREPVDVLPDGTVIDGARRVEAAALAGLTHIPARVWARESDYHEYVILLCESLIRDLSPETYFSEV